MSSSFSPSSESLSSLLNGVVVSLNAFLLYLRLNALHIAVLFVVFTFLKNLGTIYYKWLCPKYCFLVRSHEFIFPIHVLSSPSSSWWKSRGVPLEKEKVLPKQGPVF
jgi:hypothetical protein